MVDELAVAAAAAAEVALVVVVEGGDDAEGAVLSDEALVEAEEATAYTAEVELEGALLAEDPSG